MKDMVDRPTGTVTFLFTDIEGSTRLLQQLREGYDDVLSTHARLLREAFEEFEGHEIDTQGDAFFVAFPGRATPSPLRLPASARSPRSPGPTASRYGCE
jgi:class 3 adenylate cyclase